MRCHTPGTNPLVVQPHTAAEREDLIALAREAGERARSMAWRRRGDGGRFLPDDPEVS